MSLKSCPLLILEFNKSTFSSSLLQNCLITYLVEYCQSILASIYIYPNKYVCTVFDLNICILVELVLDYLCRKVYSRRIVQPVWYLRQFILAMISQTHTQSRLSWGIYYPCLLSCRRHSWYCNTATVAEDMRCLFRWMSLRFACATRSLYDFLVCWMSSFNRCISPAARRFQRLIFGFA